jgi:bifunctional N-acetylglucosamine-1-phosphate-uridyltransferase/glucosamine-1-phosphate-acetyltransferase GlmU-like protein
MAKDIVTVIIPAAGYGKRVGSPPAKELMLWDGEPLIQWSLDICRVRGWRPLVVVRKHKAQLIQFCERSPDIDLHVISESEEWPHSVLLAQEHWTSKNLVLLPDTRFAPAKIVDALISDLSERALSFAYFETNQPLSTWGLIAAPEGDTASLPFCAGVEKPDTTTASYLINVEKLKESGCSLRPWGLFAFRKEKGFEILNHLLQSTMGKTEEEKYYQIQTQCNFRKLSHFSDLTRG